MTNDELLQSLRSAVEADDPVPREVVAVAKRAQQWDTSLELLLTTYDSATSELASSGLRSTVSVRDITLSAGEVELELTISEGRVDGYITPDTTTVELVAPGEANVFIEVDPAGRFTIETSTAVGSFVVTNKGVSHRTELLNFVQ